MSRLNWNLLLSDARRKDLHDDKGEQTGTKGMRTEAERDADRILFASPTRRLADKTQVFPLDPSDSVRTRLTHSYEVSNLARSMGMNISFNFPVEVFGKHHDKLNVKRKVPAILAAIGLAHDLGNPPFGHQGEEAIKNWFVEQESNNRKLNQSKIILKHSDNITEKDLSVDEDFKKFDGNPHTFRLLTKLQILNDDFGLNLTCGTLAALVKYPSICGSKNNGGYSKFGIFKSEENIIKEVWQQTGLSEGVRHPLTHIMEACDDIAYAVLDAEDTVKKGFASFYDLMDHLDDSDDEIIKQVRKKSMEKNKEYKKENLSSSELNEISMQMFRVFAIFHLIDSATNGFVKNIEKIMSGESSNGFELIKNSEGNALCNALKKFDRRYGFQNKQVLELELKGQNLIDETMTLLWRAIDNNETAYSRYATALISENYRRAYDRSQMPETYRKHQLLCDSISGMTDSYLISIHNKLATSYK